MDNEWIDINEVDIPLIKDNKRTERIIIREHIEPIIQRQDIEEKTVDKQNNTNGNGVIWN